MAGRVKSCPNCGGQVSFRADTSLLAVCPFCDSAVARLGDDITEAELLGKVAPLADLGSPLSIGERGKWGKLGFVLLGQVQYDHGAGRWNEWYAYFDDGRWGWVSEAQGQVYVTFSQQISTLPSWEALQPGSKFHVGIHTLVVTEKNEGSFVSGKGELPFRARPSDRYRYCDVRGEGVFGTLDFGEDGDPQNIFLGQELSYEALFGRKMKVRSVVEAAVAVALNCPNCGAGLSLQAPDQSKRVTCGNCEALLDCEKGSELFVLNAAAPRLPQPLLPLGAKARFYGVEYQVLGQLGKRVHYDGVYYRWTEYLLNGGPQGGFRWLVESQGHWSFVEPLDAARVKHQGKRVQVAGLSYALFNQDAVEVEGLRGEFYWKVAVGDIVSSRDFVRSPKMVSEERTSREINYSMGRYVSAEEVQSGFKQKLKLPYPTGIAPHQPNPSFPHAAGAARIALLACLAIAVLGLGRWMLASTKVVHQSEHTMSALSKPAKSGRVKGRKLGPFRFVVPERGNIAITAKGRFQNGVLYLIGRFEDLDHGRGRPVGLRVETYGSKSVIPADGFFERRIYLGQVSPGNHELSLSPEWFGDAKQLPQKIVVTVTSDVFLVKHLLVIAIAVWILPILAVYRGFSFEKQRWSESGA